MFGKPSNKHKFQCSKVHSTCHSKESVTPVKDQEGSSAFPVFGNDGTSEVKTYICWTLHLKTCHSKAFR